ncbi:phospholipid/cholesterol/gamma-HCH transport system substrate-binding protein [Aeromicrobium panaciterrae]|uniref:Phospholipid/cholesterol/gamma-HCH transport system substrate-binding protein n=1 Tax=Aeromicrobium panaciterrae TaxID=363861 RepID=A0ABU1URJ4_9ACTN|nr:MCE family protein [Aeromicrobium panaciterrae]MDR7087813.1 phospholipid/cholesterol/gamma-HCH transport system substrate-binding protein [Aeromicrobium panaciterrae]
MTPFRERNPVTIGIIGIAAIALMMLAAFRADRLPIIGSGDTYHAQFAEIGALKTGNEVRVAGVSVGKVNKIELAGNKVLVTFKIDKGTKFGTETGADIRVRTLLGAEYLAITPEGPGQLPKGSTIPLERTIAPYDVVQAFSDLSKTTDALDVPQLGEALNTLGEIAAETPEEFRGAIKGVSDLSVNLAARDDQINTLLVSLKKVTGVLNSRNDELVTLFKDSDTLFNAISDRRDSIHRLLVSTQQISTELSALVKGTKADLKPALDQLLVVTDMLRKNEASLDEALRQFPAFLRLFSNSLGTGPWFDTYLGGAASGAGIRKQLEDAIAGAGG